MCLTQEGRSEAETLECARSYGVDLEYDSPPKRGMSYAEKVRRRDANEAADIERRQAANVSGVGMDQEVGVEGRHSQVAQISQQFGGQVQATNTQGTRTMPGTHNNTEASGVSHSTYQGHLPFNSQQQQYGYWTAPGSGGLPGEGAWSEGRY